MISYASVMATIVRRTHTRKGTTLKPWQASDKFSKAMSPYLHLFVAGVDALKEPR